MLTEQQIRFFETFGYLHLPNLLGDAVQQATQLFDDIFERDKVDIRDWRHEAHYDNARLILLQFIERDPFLSNLLEHEGIDQALAALLGDNYLYRASEANIFTGDTYWHSDLYNADFKYRHVKILFYLDEIDANSGAIRVIPGSHLFGDEYANQLERYVWEHDKNYAVSKEQVPCVTIPTKPGDGVLFDYRLKHATCNSGEHRRMFTVCASEAFKNEDLPSLQTMVDELGKMSGGKFFQEGFVEQSPPQRQKHLDQILHCIEAIEAQD